MQLVFGAFPRACGFGLSLQNIPTLKILKGNSIAGNSPGYLPPEGCGKALGSTTI